MISTEDGKGNCRRGNSYRCIRNPQSLTPSLSPQLQVHQESSVPHSLYVSTVTVTGASGIVSVSQSFGSFGRDYKSIFPARDAKSNSIEKPEFSKPKVW
ncbi:UNVERIFIED_CONTAM: hypothetical protein FKN15_065028 [Acipenser sinensis]